MPACSENITRTSNAKSNEEHDMSGMMLLLARLRDAFWRFLPVDLSDWIIGLNLTTHTQQKYLYHRFSAHYGVRLWRTTVNNSPALFPLYCPRSFDVWHLPSGCVGSSFDLSSQCAALMSCVPLSPFSGHYISTAGVLSNLMKLVKTTPLVSGSISFASIFSFSTCTVSGARMTADAIHNSSENAITQPQ